MSASAPLHAREFAVPSEDYRIIKETMSDEPRIEYAEPLQPFSDATVAGRLPAGLAPGRRSAIVRLTAVIKFLVMTNQMIMVLPLFRLLQDLICHRRLGDNSPGLIDEDRCRADDSVQAELAMLTGWISLLASIVSLLSAFPFGLMADRVGRKPTLALAYLGLALEEVSWPPLLWFAQAALRRNPWLLAPITLLTLVGGGIYVMVPTLYAVAADVSTERGRASSFVLLTFGTTAAALVGPLVAGLLMDRYGPWAPIGLIIACVPLPAVLIALLPETLPSAKSNRGKSVPGPQSDSEPDDSPWPKPVSIVHQLRQQVSDLMASVALLRNPNVLLIMPAFLLQAIYIHGYSATLTLHVTTYFKLPISRVGVILGVIGLCRLVVLILLPRLSARLSTSRPAGSAFKRDALMAGVSFALLAVAALAQGLFQSIGPFVAALAVGTLGVGNNPLSRAVLTHHIRPDLRSRAFVLVAVVEAVGAVFGGPGLAWCFARGLTHRGLWSGLPWFYIAAFCAFACLCLSFVGPPSPAAPDTDGLANHPWVADEPFIDQSSDLEEREALLAG